MKQKLLLRITALLVAVMLMPQAAWALKGSGTYNSPYLLEFGQDLDFISALYRDGKVDGQYIYIRVVADLYVNHITPIGNEAHPFFGSFYGNGYTINFIDSEINYKYSHSGILFGYVKGISGSGEELCSICNFTVNGKISSSTAGLTNIGGVIGTAINTFINRITCNVDIDVKGVAQHHIGGIVGHFEGYAPIQACTYNGVINAGTTTDCVGGIAGFVHAQSDAYIDHCCSSGSIYSTGSEPTLGGILGYNNNENNKFKGLAGCFSSMGLHYAGKNTHVCGVAGRLRANASKTENNFCLTDSCGGKPCNTDGPSIPSSNKTCTHAECQSGYITYTLANAPYIYDILSNAYNWVQELGSETYPRLRRSDPSFTYNGLEQYPPYVYKIQDRKCNGTNYGTPYYSNTNSYNTYHNGSWVERKEPTCTAAGNVKHYHCNDCGKNFTSETGGEITNVSISALGHDLSSAWAWNDNGQSTKLTVTCKRTGCTHKKEATATYPNGGITRQQKSAPSCFAKGVNTYTATLTVDSKSYTSSKDVQDIAMIAHTLKSTWAWNDNGQSAKLTVTCTATGCTHKKESTATYPNGGITRKQKSAPTCSKMGVNTYTATLTVDGNKYTQTKDVQDIPLSGHNFAGGECATCHEHEYLTFTATGSVTLGIENKNGNAPSVEYTLDDGATWTTWDYTAINLTDGQKLRLRGSNPTGFSNPGNDETTSIYDIPYSIFTTSGSGTLAASGYLMSLIDVHSATTAIPSRACFYRLFEYNKNLTTPPLLSATALTADCYRDMFYSCTKLTSAPALPATTLAEICYNSMFQNCRALSEAPALPATTLAENCYAAMFRNCLNLTQAPELPATTLAEYCYDWMFDGCTSLTQAPELPASTLAENCYAAMFMNCTSLSEAPALPATTLVYGCYTSMFYDCASLNRIEVAFTDWSNSYTYNWLANVASEGEFVCPKELQLKFGPSYIPEGWTVKHNDEPEFATGDVNGDGIIDVVDINVLVSITLGNASADDYNGRADVNGDGAIDIIDINAILAIIL
ncbi:dockerin type I repeat-containing protein [Sodaliphilus sp.]|uniref:dockerin type I repeat-containing protein n=1 Tax=Sodaliphilus sp. TaxID=2815818 RepID=UPI00388D7D25